MTKITYRLKCPYCGATRTADTYSGDTMGFVCTGCGGHMDIAEQYEDEVSHFNVGIVWFVMIFALFVIVPVAITCANKDKSFQYTAETPVLDKENILDPEEARGEDYGEDEYVIEDSNGVEYTIPRPVGMRMISYSRSGSSPEVHFEARGYTVTVSYSLDGTLYDDAEAFVPYGKDNVERGKVGNNRYIKGYDEYSNSTYTTIYEDIGAPCALRISVNTTGGVVTDDFAKGLLIRDSETAANSENMAVQ